jgi:hypothetical protein
MGVNVFPAAGGGGYKRYVVNLTSGTSWTIPTGVTAINATLQGGGGGGGPGRFSSSGYTIDGSFGIPGQSISTYISGLTPGNTITYAIGAGGAAAANGGTTTMTGATNAVGGLAGGNANAGTQAAGGFNGGAGGAAGGSIAGAGGAGGAGSILIEYWL